MNKGFLTLLLTLVLYAYGLAQADLQQMAATERDFHRAVTEKGIKPAFLEYLTDDAVIFRPEAINGREFWTRREDNSPAVLVRNQTYADIAANGLLGYTTGTWELFPKGKSDSRAEFGEYVTVWGKRLDGRFRASVDIGVTHEKFPAAETDRTTPSGVRSDPNKRGWSVADSSMSFFRTSMSHTGLSGAYKKYAADEIRLLLEREQPIIGKKRAHEQTRKYRSVAFPRKIAAIESADMAYIWTPCEYANSEEGREKGNCLHIWKLRGKKWWIVLSIFARVYNETPPELKQKASKPAR